LSQFTRLTDGRTDDRRTDRILIGRPHLHFMQRSKNYERVNVKLHSESKNVWLWKFCGFAKVTQGNSGRFGAPYSQTCAAWLLLNLTPGSSRLVRVLGTSHAAMFTIEVVSSLLSVIAR